MTFFESHLSCQGKKYYTFLNNKIIQLYFSGKNYLHHDYPAKQDSYLLFGNKGDFHNEILRRFLQSVNMQTDETPEPAGKNYKAVGMGRAGIDLDKKSILFYGHSSIYQILINREFLEHLIFEDLKGALFLCRYMVKRSFTCTCRSYASACTVAHKTILILLWDDYKYSAFYIIR
ncbi:MAG: hypothetical protein HZB65_04080 [Candidatus Aenigmarchaeota archaeon]|nr:hypothetical protein [Candidatus Aenigmarchaeota archaeon]